MEKGDPPSPAPSNQGNGSNKDQTDDALLQDGFEQLIQHNNSQTTPTPLRTPTPSASYHEQQQLHHQPSHDDDYHYHPSQQQSAQQYRVDIPNYMGSDPHSRYSSPTLEPRFTTSGLAEDGFDTSPHLTHSPYPPPPSHPHSYPGAGLYQSGGYTIDPSPYPQLPEIGSSTTPHNAYSTPATSPPTSLQNDPMTTRSGRTVIRSYAESNLASQSSRAAKPASRPKKRRRGDQDQKQSGKRSKGGAATKEVELEAPLSVLCRDIELVDGPDVDIDAYVRRSPEHRRVEVAGSKDQKIKRPMNAFMLYRKAYQNRTKALRKQHNHQYISQVCGMGWNMEPQELRDHFDGLAKIERENHRLAFPDYKFSPTKNPGPKKTEEEEDAAAAAAAAAASAAKHMMDDGPVLDEYNYDSPPPSRNASRGTRSSSMFGDPDAEYRPPRGAYAHQYAPQQHQQQHQQHHQQQQQQHQARMQPQYGTPAYHSSFQYSNPGKPRPGEYGSGLGQHQYYQQTSEYVRPTYPHHMNAAYAGAAGLHSHSQGPAFIENVYVSKTNSPSGGGQSAAAFRGSPPSLDHHQQQQQQQHHYGDMMGGGGGSSAYPTPHQLSSSSSSHHLHHTAMPHQRQHNTPTPPPPHHQHHQHHHIDPSLMPQPGGGGGSSAYDDLGILGLDQGGDFGDTMAPYDLVEHHHSHHQPHHSSSHHHQQQQQQQQQATATTTNHSTSASASAPAAVAEASAQWQDDPAAAAAAADETKLGREWEMLGESGEFQLEDIDQILGTTGSPG